MLVTCHRDPFAKPYSLLSEEPPHRNDLHVPFVHLDVAVDPGVFTGRLQGEAQDVIGVEVLAQTCDCIEEIDSVQNAEHLSARSLGQLGEPIEAALSICVRYGEDAQSGVVERVDGGLVERRHVRLHLPSGSIRNCIIGISQFPVRNVDREVSRQPDQEFAFSRAVKDLPDLAQTFEFLFFQRSAHIFPSERRGFESLFIQRSIPIVPSGGLVIPRPAIMYLAIGFRKRDRPGQHLDLLDFLGHCFGEFITPACLRPVGLLFLSI